MHQLKYLNLGLEFALGFSTGNKQIALIIGVSIIITDLFEILVKGEESSPDFSLSLNIEGEKKL